MSATHAGSGVSGSSGAAAGSSEAGALAPPAGAGGTAGAFAEVDAAVPEAVPECAAGAIPAERKRLDLYLMIDTNFFVDWTAFVDINGGFQLVADGVTSYSRSTEAAGTGLGVELINAVTNPVAPLFDPQGCDYRDHATPQDGAGVGVDPLPSNADAVERALAGVQPSLTTPLTPALEGAVAYASSRQRSYPDQTQAVVLISDGFLDFTCASNAASLAERAARGFAMGIRTYAIELLIPSPLPIGGTLIPLDPVANAGGTRFARSINMFVDNSTTLRNTLLEIQRDAEPCDYALPASAEWDHIQLAIDTSAGPAPLPRLADPIECDSLGGAYLDTSAATAWVRACPVSCYAIKSSGRTPLWVVDCAP